MTSHLNHPQKLQFSGHETFPLRQLWLRKAYSALGEGTIDPELARNIFVEESAIRHFGVGKNMVSSIRHWALSCDVLQEGPKSSIERGPIGNLLFGEGGLDPYLENPSTAWLVHWLLAGRATRSTTWYWLFNRVTQQIFNRDEVVSGLRVFAQQRGARVSETTLKRDVEVCLRCYLPRTDGREGDDAAEPLLVELGLISEGTGGSLQFRRGHQASLHDGVFCFALIDFWKYQEGLLGSGQSTLSFDLITHGFGSPGRVFKLDENAVAERLSSLEEMTKGALRWSDSAGMRQVSRHSGFDSSLLQERQLGRAYGRQE